MITNYYHCFHQQPQNHWYFLLLVNLRVVATQSNKNVQYWESPAENSQYWQFTEMAVPALFTLWMHFSIHSFTYLSQAPILCEILCWALWIPSLSKNRQCKTMSSYPGGFTVEQIRIIPSRCPFQCLWPLSPQIAASPQVSYSPHDYGSLSHIPYLDHFPTYLMFCGFYF